MSSALSLDPTATDPREVAAIVPVRFWQRYMPVEDDPTKTKTCEMVEWAKKGQHLVTGQKTTMRINQARKDKQIWAALEPYYNSWKTNQEAPVDGTPLGAWPGLTPEQADRLRMLRVRSVEDVAAMTDADIERFGMGGLAMRQQARAFCEAKKDRTQVQAEVAKQLGARDAELAARDEKLAEMGRQLEALQAQLAAKPAETPRRGRPPKQEAA